jgi:N-acetylglucosamine-6-sulfatase
MRKGLVTFALVALAALVAVSLGAAPDPAGAKTPKPQTRPNVVVVMVDDMPMSFMGPATTPNIIDLLGNQGTTFNNFVVTTPLCCPSRATYLTGQYGHNNGVLANRPGYAALVDKQNVLPAWLNRAGYFTAHVGRYLNGYKNVRKSKPGPGWDGWYTELEPRDYYSYDLQVNGDTEHYGKKPKDYLTSVINRYAVKVIKRQAKKSTPFYLQVDHLAPHDEWRDSEGPCGRSAIPGPGDLTQFLSERLPAPPSFNEDDMSDKPFFLHSLEKVNEFAYEDIQREWRCRMASMLAVDRGVAKIVATLQAKGELDNTLIAFTSDNGFYHGEHRVPYEKYLPYEEGIHMPLLVRFPTSVGAVPAVDTMTANIDLAPTILELAGAGSCIGKQGTNCRAMDGRSLLPLARGETPDWAPDRHILLELDRRFGEESLPFRPCFYQGVRTVQYSYVEYLSVPGVSDGLCRETRQIDFYDIGADPYQLENLFPTPPATPEREAHDRLVARLNTLRDCAGIEGRDPAPASGHYCE